MFPLKNEVKSSGAQKKVNYDSFLKLLVAQIKHQDPTEPMKASEQIAQLAVFSQVEESIKVNSNLQELLNSNRLAQAASYIGKKIIGLDGVKKGVISSVELTPSGLVALTSDHQKIPVEIGIVLSN
ncbi:flagellar basal body rod modification protein FlgD [Liberibacter crescens]|nr:flagellar basal body rod modification protein FlgD [Liberibacter crescens]